MNNEEHKPESPEEALHRMVGEESELETLPEMADQENANALSTLLREKHDAEFAIGRPFESMLEYQRYTAHKMAEESHFAPDPEGQYTQGEVMRIDGVSFTYLGTDEKGNAVLRRVSKGEEGDIESKEDVLFPMSDLYEEVSEESESSSPEVVPGEVPSEIMTVASPEEASDHNPSVTEFSPIDQKGQSIFEEKKSKEVAPNFLGRILQAVERGEEIPLHVIKKMQKTGTPEEKAWAAKEPELRKSAEPIQETKKEPSKRKTIADHLRAAQDRGEVVDEKTLRDVARDARNPEDMEWAKAELAKRQVQNAPDPVAPPVQSVQSEVNPTQVSEAYKHETPDVDEHASPEMIEALKEAGIHVPEGKTLTAFEAQKLMRTVLGARGSSQIEANDVGAAKKFTPREATTTTPEGDPEKAVFAGLDALSPTPPEGDEKMEPLIERNLSGKPEFISELDAQGEAMQHLIDNTPEAINLGKTQKTPDASYPPIEEKKGHLEYKPDFVLVNEHHSDHKPNFVMVEDSSRDKENYPVVPYVPFNVVTTEEEKKEISQEISEKFIKQFSISAEQLQSVEGFSDLSSGQQRLVLERMKLVAFDDINAEKVSRYRTRIDELSKSDSWWDKVKGMGMKVTKQLQLGRTKDEVSAEWLKGEDVDAAAMKKDALLGLVAQALQTKEFGVIEHEGKLDTVFVAPEDFGEDINEVTKVKINYFNTIANQYANKSFAENDDAGKAQLKAQYESSAREITRLLAKQEEGQWGGENAAAWRTKLEGAVQMSRFFQDNPEVDKELETAGRNIGSAIGFKNLLAERGTYTAVSMGARWLGVSAMGLAAIPAVAFLGGGVMGWLRAKQELSENDLLSAMGERDKSDDKAHEKEQGSNIKDRAKNVVEGGVLVTKLENLLKEYDAASETEKQALKTRLEARVAYTTRKMEEELIDLGSARGDRMERMSSLALTLGKAQAELGFADGGVNAIETRLNSILDIREEKIEANRKVHIKIQAAKGAVMGAAFSGAGMLIGGMLPGHATAGDLNVESPHQLSDQDAKAVGDAIRGEVAPGVPPEVAAPQQAALAKGFSEYMAADAAGKKLIAETLGMTTEQMDAKIAGILSAPSAEQLSGQVVEHTPPAAETAARAYEVKSGDNLSHIMKAHLSIFKDLTPAQQENVIQNFIRDLSPQELKDIGITDVNHINVGEQIHVERLNEILAAKRIGGEDLIEHAQRIHGGVSEVVSEVVPTGGEGIAELTLSPLSSEDAAQIEGALGRSLSATESHVLHSLKGLSPFMESDAERQSLGEALSHLQKEMEASGGKTLTMPEMQRILHEHNGLDAQIKFPKVVHEPLLNVVTETASSTPLPPGIPKEHIANWQELPMAVRGEESVILGSHYLKADMDNLFGKDVLGNTAKEWVQIRELSAEEIFGAHANEFHSNNPSIVNIQDYVKAEGFTIENGYIPNKGESIEQFLHRVHATRVLVGGPRPEQH